MKSKSFMKIGKIFLLVIIISMIFITHSFAYIDISDMSAEDKAGITGPMKTVAGDVIGIIQVIGMAVATIMLIVLAIKYLTAAPNDKAEIKKHAVVYIVGALVLFGASGILEIIKNIANSINAS